MDDEIILSAWNGKDPLTLGEIMFLWFGLPPNLNPIELRAYPNKHAAARGIFDRIKSLAEKGEIECDRPMTKETTKFVPSADGAWNFWAGRSNTIDGVNVRVPATPVPWKQAKFTLAAIRKYAESIGQYPAFFFHEQHRAPSGAPPKPTFPLQRQFPLQRHQEAEILRVILELGHNPKALPKAGQGRRGVKAEVRGILSGDIWQGTVFDAAWKRLRNMNEIADA